MLSPVAILLILWIGIMAGGSPTAAAGIEIFLTVFAFVLLLPAGVLLFQVMSAKLFDGILRCVPFSRAEISWIGILLSALLVVALGNLFVDDLYQFKQGNYAISVVVLCLDIGGMAAVIVAGGGRLPLIGRGLSNR
ncbi:MAG: hypothetical protein HQL88_05435 [Magnetococcales bacterium]|nr:hypothetical protein [Magnetococcales bacterium]